MSAVALAAGVSFLLMVSLLFKRVSVPAQIVIVVSADGYDIKTAGFLGGPWRVLQVMFGRGAQFRLFARIHGFGGCSKIRGLAEAHLDKNQGIPFPHDQIDFTIRT